MIHLKIFEEFFDKDQFKSFLDKYRKSGYISKGSIKKLDKSDLKYDYFKNILDRVTNCISFTNDTDIELLQDILQEAYDECSYIDRDSVLIWFSLTSNDKENYGGDTVNTIISEDINGKPCYRHEKTSDTLKVVDSIIDGLNNSRIRSISKYEDEIKNAGKPGGVDKPRAGIKPRRYDTIRRLKTINLLKKVTIGLELHISIWFHFPEIYFLGDDPYRFEEMRQKDKILYKFESDLKNCVERYFRAIGRYDTKFSIRHGSPYYSQVDFTIIIEV